MNITKFLKKEKGKERKSERITEIKEEGINKGKIKEKKKGVREKEEEEGRKENGKKKKQTCDQGKEALSPLLCNIVLDFSLE